MIKNKTKQIAQQDLSNFLNNNNTRNKNKNKGKNNKPYLL